MPAPATPAASPSVDGPLLTPDAVWQKLILLAENLHSEQDLRRESIERLLGLPLKPRDGSDDAWFVAGPTNAGWNYIFELALISENDRRVEFTTYLPDLDTAAHVSPTCTFPFNRLQDALAQQGFDANDVSVSNDRIYAWKFTKNRLAIESYFYFTRGYAGVNDPDFDTACVDKVSFSIRVPTEE